MNSRFKNCKTALGSGKEYRETFEEVYIELSAGGFQPAHVCEKQKQTSGYFSA